MIYYPLLFDNLKQKGACCSYMSAVVQDNREPGENPGRSRRCMSRAFFRGLFRMQASPCRKAVTVEMGRRKNVMKLKSEDLPFCLEL